MRRDPPVLADVRLRAGGGPPVALALGALVGAVFFPSVWAQPLTPCPLA